MKVISLLKLTIENNTSPNSSSILFLLFSYLTKKPDGKYKLLDQMDPFLYGGQMINSVNKQNSTWNELPLKFEAGTPNIGEVISLEDLRNSWRLEVRWQNPEFGRYICEKGSISIDGLYLLTICDITGTFSIGNKALCKPSTSLLRVPLPAANIHNL